MLVVVFDIGGYTAGVLSGKHRMVPAISPRSPGGTGCLLCGTVAAVLAVAFLMREALVGRDSMEHHAGHHGHPRDLVESQVKRDLGIRT